MTAAKRRSSATFVLMGASVDSGTATVALATDACSYFGTPAAHASATATTPNASRVGVKSVSWLLIRIAAVMVPSVFVIDGVTKGDWLQAFLFASSVAQGMAPEVLPLIVTGTLPRGAVVLSRKYVSPEKRLDHAEAPAGIR